MLVFRPNWASSVQRSNSQYKQVRTKCLFACMVLALGELGACINLLELHSYIHRLVIHFQLTHSNDTLQCAALTCHFYCIIIIDIHMKL